MTAIKNNHWVIKNQPVDGNFVFDQSSPEATFELMQNTIDVDAELKDDHVLVQSVYLSNDPAQRFWIYTPYKAYGGRVPVGHDVPARGIGKVLKSKSSKYKQGDYIYTTLNWSQYSIVDANGKGTWKLDTTTVPLTKAPLHYHISLLGFATLTVAIGILKVAQVSEYDTGLSYLVTGAAGAVGNMVVQLASNVFKARKVYATAGGPEKVKFVESLAPNVVGIDYKDPNFKQNFANAVGDDEIDVFFDNVGGDLFEYALEFIKSRGTVVACGQISTYKDKKPRPFYGLQLMLSKRIKFQGFIVTDYVQEIPLVQKKIIGYFEQGKIKNNATIIDARGDNIAKVPQAWHGLFEGTNKGKLITQLSDE